MKIVKTKKIKLIDNETMIVTVDISKDNHFGYCVAPDGREVKPFKFSNNRSGFNHLWDKVLIFQHQTNLSKIIVGFESTSVYAEPLEHFLMEKPVQLVQVNPMHTKKVKELSDNSPNKTDAKDPRVLADIIRLGRFLSVIIPKGEAACLRQLTHARERAICQRTAFINQLRSLVFKIFPEFTTVIKDVCSKTARYLFYKYPTPEDFASIDAKELGIITRGISRGRVGEELCSKLIQIAHNSTGIKEGLTVITMEIKDILKRIESINNFIKSIEQEMNSTLSKIPAAKNILSINGLGIITTAGLIGEVGDFEKFDSQSQIIKMAGLNLWECSSGKYKGKCHISKRGRSLLRKLLYFASVRLIKKGGIMHDYYNKLIEKGMIKTKALIAVSRKLIRVVYAIMRDNSVYIEHHTPFSLKKVA